MRVHCRVGRTTTTAIRLNDTPRYLEFQIKIMMAASPHVRLHYTASPGADPTRYRCLPHPPEKCSGSSLQRHDAGLEADDPLAPSQSRPFRLYRLLCSRRMSYAHVYRQLLAQFTQYDVTNYDIITVDHISKRRRLDLSRAAKYRFTICKSLWPELPARACSSTMLGHMM